MIVILSSSTQKAAPDCLFDVVSAWHDIADDFMSSMLLRNCTVTYSCSLCRLTVSQKLALLHTEAGSLDAARTVLLAAQRTAQHARSAFNQSLEGAEDERFRLICASRSHPDAAVSGHTAFMTEEEQILANLHADIIMLLADVQLRIGVRDQAARAIRASEKKVASLQQRREQVWSKTTAPSCVKLMQISEGAFLDNSGGAQVVYTQGMLCAGGTVRDIDQD